MATIQKHKDSYYIRVSNGYDSKGKQLVQRMTWKPESGMTDKQIVKELNRAVVEFENKVTSGGLISESKTRLADFCPLYLKNVEDKLSPLTIVSYKQVIDGYIIPALGNLKLRDIKPQHVKSFVNNLGEDGIRVDGKKGKLSHATIKRIYTILQAILHNACKLDLIASNPANHEKIDLPAQQIPNVEIFTQEEAIDMFECLSAEPLMYQLLIYLAIITGCRRGELTALRWSDIDFKKFIISISKSNYTLKGKGVLTKEPKTAGSVRVISIPQCCIDLLKDYRKEQRLTRLSVGDKWQENNWIFTQWNGLPLYPTTPTLWFDKFLKRNGLRHRKFHALRHTSATLLLAGGANIKTVGSRLGQKKLSTTNRYVHDVESADVAAADSFQAMFTKKA